MIPLPIENLGATCYMNSVLQALNQVEPLVQFMLSRCTGYYKPDTIGSAYVNLVKKIQIERPAVIDPESFCIPVFEKYFAKSRDQQDAAEFLGQLLDSLSDNDILDSIKKNKDKYERMPRPIFKTEVNEIFLSVLQDTLSFENSKQHANQAEKIVLISIEKEISFTNKSEEDNLKEYREAKKKDASIEYKSLKTCLDRYFSQEELDQSNWVRRQGKPVKTFKKLSLLLPAPFFIIQLKRNVTYGKYLQSIALKLEHPVTFPLTNLDLSAYSVTPLQSRYDLLAVVQHTGTYTKTKHKDGRFLFTSSGHYTAYVKHGEQWFFCDDRRKITAKTTEEMKKIAQDGSDGTFTPYILFYKKQLQPSFIFEPDPTCFSSQMLDNLFDLQNRLQILTS